MDELANNARESWLGATACFLRSIILDHSIDRHQERTFICSFSPRPVTLPKTNEAERGKSIGFVRKLRRDCEIFPDSPEMWAPLMARLDLMLITVC